VPLRDDNDAMTVNWLEIAIADAAGEVTYCFVIDPPVNADNVVEIAAAGRARWKIENGSFNVLKTKGYNLEHSFGTAKATSAAVLVTLNLLAFLFHTVAECAEDLWRKALAIAGTRVAFSKLRDIGFRPVCLMAGAFRYPDLQDLPARTAVSQQPVCTWTPPSGRGKTPRSLPC
jgi:hypothetical protein